MPHPLTSAIAGVVVAGALVGPPNPPGFASPRADAVQADGVKPNDKLSVSSKRKA